jgi:hypothetical protein
VRRCGEVLVSTGLQRLQPKPGFRVFEAGRSRAMGGGLQSCPALRLPLGGPEPDPPGRLAYCEMALTVVPDLALESRVLRLHPLSAIPARISAADALRDDPLQAHLAGPGEHERSLGHHASLNRTQSTPATSGESAARRSSIHLIPVALGLNEPFIFGVIWQGGSPNSDRY